jgi:hypothetical protein
MNIDKYNILHVVLNNELGRSIRKFLEAELPSCDTQWWDRCVIANLTYGRVGGRQVTSLTELDLAALLRVFDKNWDNINKLRDNQLSIKTRNFLKEMQSIRNDMAHLVPDRNLNPEDFFRCLDTAWRLMADIGADASSIERVKMARNKAFLSMIGNLEIPPTPVPPTATPTPEPLPLRIGQLVQGEFRRILEAGVGNDDEFELQIQLLQDLDYSKEMFHLQYPVLQEERLSRSGQYRYYVNPLWIRGKKYYLCSQWSEISRPLLERWIRESR